MEGDKKCMILNEETKEIRHCQICMEHIDGNIVRLKCNPDNHVFCEECITNWYKELKKNKYKYCYDSENEYIQRMCPMCRLDGGLLPLFKLENYIPSIHERKLYKDKSKIKLCGFEITKENKSCRTCKLPNGDNQEVREIRTCKRQGIKKYNGLCAQHYKIQKKDEEEEEDDIFGEDDMKEVENEWIHDYMKVEDFLNTVDEVEKSGIEIPEDVKKDVQSSVDKYKNELEEDNHPYKRDLLHMISKADTILKPKKKKKIIIV